MSSCDQTCARQVQVVIVLTVSYRTSFVVSWTLIVIQLFHIVVRTSRPFLLRFQFSCSDCRLFKKCKTAKKYELDQETKQTQRKGFFPGLSSQVFQVFLPVILNFERQPNRQAYQRCYVERQVHHWVFLTFI